MCHYLDNERFIFKRIIKKYNSGQNAFVQFAKMKTGVFSSGFAQWNNKIIITGGRTLAEEAIPQVQVVDETMTWKLPDMQENIVGHCMVETVANTFVIVGGTNNDGLRNKTSYIAHTTNESKIVF